MLQTNFQDQFFSHAMHQLFNKQGAQFESDSTEHPVRKWLRAHDEL